MTLVQKFQSFIAKGNRANWCLFLLFTGILFVKCLCFHYSYSQHFLWSSLWKAPAEFWRFYLPFLSISTALAGFIFCFKRKDWIIYASVLLDVWMIANLMYYRSYNMFIDAYAITMIGNLNDGYWNSLTTLLEWKDIIFPILTLILCLFLLCFNNQKRKPIIIIFILLFSLGTHWGHFLLVKAQPYDYWGINFNCFNKRKNNILMTTFYEKRYSIIHSLFLNIDQSIRLCFPTEKLILSEAEKAKIAPFTQPISKTFPSENLLLIIVESLETWLINPTIMPNTWNFMQSHATLHAPKIKRQVAAGLSSDAQLIINTGLLPTKQGAVSHLYMENRFPAIAEIYDSLSISIASTPLDDCWHQWAMNRAYQFNVGTSESSNDSLLFTAVLKAINQEYRYIQVFTISSHTPFTAGTSSSLQLPNDFPELFANYIKSVNVFDEGLSVLLSAMETNPILQNTTIVITGDHTTLFSKEKRHEYDAVCKKFNKPYEVVKNEFVPLIIYSPKIKENIKIDDICYQMDIYPTILHLIGAEDYYWKGFGVNLLDSTARYNRPITEEQAYQLSDKLIRADYFRELQQ